MTHLCHILSLLGLPLRGRHIPGPYDLGRDCKFGVSTQTHTLWVGLWFRATAGGCDVIAQRTVVA
jgi:hypothetical protein